MSKNQLTVYHRAFKSFLSELQNAKAERKLQEALLVNRQEHKAYLEKLQNAGKDEKLREAIVAGFGEKEYMDTTRFTCSVEVDWIEMIEAKLPYVERAVMENRQFILQEGNVVGIEQAKRISKSSVAHLARHSEMITHEPEQGEDLIPDKVYIVENIDNYAVYENRFLYMLLCYLAEFVDTRYSEIVKKWNSFISDSMMSRTVSIGKRTLKYDFRLQERSENDTSTAYDDETKGLLDRMRRIQQETTSLLNMPLMKEASHAPLLTPPITRTNVLKMDVNFREAVELYDYLSNYGKKGYSVNEIHNKLEPFSIDALENFSEVLALFSYLTYRHGGDLEKEMEKAYLEEERMLKMVKEQEMLEHLEALKKELNSSGSSVAEYLSALEKRNAYLDTERAKLLLVEEEFRSKEKQFKQKSIECREMEHSIQTLNHTITQKDAEMQRKTAEHIQQVEKLRAEHAEEIREKDQIIDKCQEDNLLLNAQLHALRGDDGAQKENEYLSQEEFHRLEKEYAAFQKYFDKQWQNAKKGMRRGMWKQLKKSATDNTQAENAQADSEEET